MSKISLIQSALILTLIGCAQPKNHNTLIDNDLVTKGLALDTISLDDLIIKQGDSIVKAFYLYDSMDFTGYAVEYQMTAEGNWSFVRLFKDGVMQRLDVHGVNGYQHRFVEMINGYEYHTIMFHRNGNKYLETFYDKQRNPIGIWKRWYESGELEWEKNYN